MFIWSAIAHMALPLGHAGIHNGLPGEEKALAALQTGLGDQGGLYLFPGSGPRRLTSFAQSLTR